MYFLKFVKKDAHRNHMVESPLKQISQRTTEVLLIYLMFFIILVEKPFMQ